MVLVVDDGFLPQLKVKVSSAILACFSKVFRALFSSRFAEGQGVQAGVKEVAISDDPRALLSLCRILHRKTLLDRHIGTASALLDFALIVDKYDCVEIIKHELEGLLRNLERCPDWDIRYGTASMLTAAYLLDQPEDFRRLTRSLVLKETSSLYSLGERCEELLPTTILSKPTVSRLLAYASYILRADNHPSFSQSAARLRPARVDPSVVHHYRQVQHSGIYVTEAEPQPHLPAEPQGSRLVAFGLPPCQIGRHR